MKKNVRCKVELSNEQGQIELNAFKGADVMYHIWYGK